MHIMHSITVELANAFSKHVDHIDTTPTFKHSRLDQFDFQCNDVMSVAPRAGIPPKVLAERIALDLQTSNSFASVTVSGPGFINVRLSDESILANLANLMIDGDIALPNVGNGQSALIDFGGPNVAKPLHVGHLRSFVIGESLRRILSATGHHVISDIHLGDWGLQMGMLLSQVLKLYPGIAVDTVGPKLEQMGVEDLDELYVQASKECKSDEISLATARKNTQALQSGDPLLTAIWEHMRQISLTAVMEQVGTLGAHFDLLLGESDSNEDIDPMIAELSAKGVVSESDGALVAFHSEGEPPLILRKSDGAAIYGSTDLAALRDRVLNHGASKIIYVVDQRQSQHLQAVFAVGRIAGFADGVELVHAGFGTVNGFDGKPFKTRDGGVAKLADLMDASVAKAFDRLASKEHETALKVGLAALKFADLSSDRLSGYVFDPERMTSFEGKTGPYLQYACARINAVLKKASALVAIPSEIEGITHSAERDLALAILAMPVSVLAALNELQPKEVADRAWAIAQAFSRFYTECPVIQDGAVSEERLALCDITNKALRKCLWLLGVEVPEAM